MSDIIEKVLVGLAIATVVIGQSALIALAVHQTLELQRKLDEDYDRAWGTDKENAA